MIALRDFGARDFTDGFEQSTEEAKGKIRWLRPEYRIPRFAAAWG